MRYRLLPMALAGALLAGAGMAQTPTAPDVHVITPQERPPMHADAAGAEWIPSPNFNARRPDAGPLDLVVLHSTCMSTDTTEEVVHWFQTPASEVSSHYVVGKDGHVVQMVSEAMRAWHAGPSDWRGRKDLNSCSIGIEMVHRDQDPKDDWPDAQVQAVARLLADIRTRHAIPDDHVVFHSEIAVPPGRKHDPVGFDRPRLLKLAAEFAAQHPTTNVITPTEPPAAPGAPAPRQSTSQEHS